MSPDPRQARRTYDTFHMGRSCKGMGPPESARLGNACGAMVVTRHACSAAMPSWEEVTAFVNDRGGL